MNPPAQPASVQPVSSAAAIPESRGSSLARRLLMAPIKLFWGMVFCQGLASSIFVVGWTYRLAQRSAFKFWFSRQPPQATTTTFAEFMVAHRATQEHVHWPNWFAQQNFRQAIEPNSELSAVRQALVVGQALGRSLWLNFWIGLRGIVNTWAVTLPACVFWWFGWYDGWNNSFSKGYEQAAAGPLISLLGVAWFITVMFYAPLAQARQAVTGEWRAFFQFRLIRKIARDRWLQCVLLALLYALLSVPLTVLKTSPMFWMNHSPALSALTHAQVIASLKGYFFWCALVMLPAYVVVHVAAARIYAAGVLSLVRSGSIAEADLAPAERDLLARLGLLAVRTEPERHRFVRFIAWTGTRVGRVVGAAVLVLVWFGFVAQIYIGEFLNYHAGRGWMNQPLIQLPWFRYFPGSVRNPLADVASALLILLVALLIRSIARGFRRRPPRLAPPG